MRIQKHQKQIKLSQLKLVLLSYRILFFCIGLQLMK
nr:MAG TPA_asm: hypothetical protein [Bacteriophage sp.]